MDAGSFGKYFSNPPLQSQITWGPVICISCQVFPDRFQIQISLKRGFLNKCPGHSKALMGYHTSILEVPRKVTMQIQRETSTSEQKRCYYHITLASPLSKNSSRALGRSCQMPGHVKYHGNSYCKFWSR